MSPGRSPSASYVESPKLSNRFGGHHSTRHFSKKSRTSSFSSGRDIPSDGMKATLKAENFTPANDVDGLAFGVARPEHRESTKSACLSVGPTCNAKALF